MSTLALQKEVYKKMLLIRMFEEKLCELYPTDAIKSPVHLSIGQEAVSVAVCMALQKTDFISNTYRCHGTHIAKGGDLNDTMIELFGKNSKMAKGKAGSMHLVDLDKGIIPASAVVGTTVPVATGFALSNKMQNNNKIVACMFGDGSTEEGSFLESINFAALHKLPIVYICENNKLAIHNPIHRRQATDQLCQRIATYGIKTYRIESGDVFEMISACKEAVALARKNQPVFMEIFTHRYLEHVGPGCDIGEDYRDKDYDQLWKDKDQIALLEQMLPEQDITTIQNEVIDLVAKAVEAANKASYASKEELFTNVYA